jgi:hypothetical protein
VSSYQHDDGELVPLDWWHDDPLVDQRRALRLAALMRQGWTFPAIKIFFRRDGRYHCVDGHTRSTASLLCGFTHVPAIIQPMPWPPESQR